MTKNNKTIDVETLEQTSKKLVKEIRKCAKMAKKKRTYKSTNKGGSPSFFAR